MATNSTLDISQTLKPAPIRSRAGLRFVANLWALTKPEINLLIAITVLVSFMVARHDFWLLSIVPAVSAMVGTLLVSSGAAALNQLLERGFDSRMRRTGRRPLVAGSVTPRSAFVFGATISILGLLYLALWVNLLSMVIAGLTFLFYLLAYTPLKRITPLCTLVGAIPGADPRLSGGLQPQGLWTAEHSRCMRCFTYGNSRTLWRSHGCTATTMSGPDIECFPATKSGDYSQPCRL